MKPVYLKDVMLACHKKTGITKPVPLYRECNSIYVHDGNRKTQDEDDPFGNVLYVIRYAPPSSSSAKINEIKVSTCKVSGSNITEESIDDISTKLQDTARQN